MKHWTTLWLVSSLFLILNASRVGANDLYYQDDDIIRMTTYCAEAAFLRKLIVRGFTSMRLSSA
jgi:hypothetical protein